MRFVCVHYLVFILIIILVVYFSAHFQQRISAVNFELKQDGKILLKRCKPAGGVNRLPLLVVFGSSGLFGEKRTRNGT